jgi:hypothetical protein
MSFIFFFINYTKNKMSNSSNIKISISKDRKGNIHASNNFNMVKMTRENAKN